MPTLYDYTYTNPATGVSYKGQVAADPTIFRYNYTPGQTFQAPNGGTYTISGSGTPTTAPAGAVYQTSYTDSTGTYDSYHYDPKNASYYNINSGYDHASGMITPPGGTPIPAWSGIGLGNEYSYVNLGTPTAPNYETYGGGGTAPVNHAPGFPLVYDYKFMYASGTDYYLGRVVDDGTFGYKVGETIPVGINGSLYTIYAVEPPAATPVLAKPGYNYIDLYHEIDTDFPPAGVVPSTPYAGRPSGYGGLSTEKSWIQHPPGQYYEFGSSIGIVGSTAPITALPPLT